MDPVPPDTRIESLLAHAGWVQALARSLSRDQASADDLVQQTWVRVLETPPASRSETGGWLATVVRNLARDRHRRDTRRARHEAAAPSAAAPSPGAEDLLTRAEAHRRLIELVVALDEPFRSTVLLRFYEGLGPAEIAARTGVEAATVRTRLHRALALLRGRVGRDVLALAVPYSVVPSSAAPGKGAAVSGSHVVGGAAVGAGKKTTAGVLLLLLALGGGGAWFVAGAGAAPPAEPETEDVADGSPAGARNRARAAADAPAAEAAAAAPVESSATAVASTAAPARRRLEVTFLRFTQPARDDADAADDDGDAPVVDVDGGGAGTMTLGGGGGWLPDPKRGVATWRVTVLDADGHPVEGAEVYRVELDADGRRASPCTFQWIESLGASDGAGVRVADRQPAGDFLVAADWNARLLGDRGLDLRSAVPAHAGTSAEPVELTVRLPFSVAATGSVTGIVRDAEGAPVRSCTVGHRHNGMTTGPDGAYTVRGLDAGDVSLTFSATGHLDRTVRTTVRAGAATRLDVRLDDEHAGGLSLAGRVVDPAGARVAGVRVFLWADDGEVARWATAGDDGAFTFRRLPDRLAETGANVMVNTHDARPDLTFLDDVTVPVPGPPVELRVEPLATVDLWFRDKETGAPLTIFSADVTLERPGREPRNVVALMQSDEQGRVEVRVPRGRLVLRVAAKGYREMDVAVEVTDVPGPYDLFADMTRE